MSTNAKRLVTEFANELLRDDARLAGNDDLVNDVFRVLLSITGSDISDRPDFSLGTNLESGFAIAPNDAASCLTDIIRTSKYVRGLRYAIIEVRKRFPDERIEILYAGCGPFATIALPLCHEFSADEISFTLVDLHEASIVSAKRVFEGLGISTFIGDYLTGDATSLEPLKKYHIILAEMMQRALEKEPQVAATTHLSKFLKKGGIFLPEKITVTVCLADLNVEFDPVTQSERIILRDICALTKDTDNIKPVTLQIPHIQTDNLNLLLATSVQIFDSIYLGDCESGITQPFVVSDIGRFIPGDSIEFAYRVGPDPRFVCRVV